MIAGRVEPSTVAEFAAITSDLSRRGAEVVLLGCTELGLLAQGDALGVEIIDSTLLHADAAWEMAAGERLAGRGATSPDGPGDAH